MSRLAPPAFSSTFLKDVAQHQLTIYRNEGLYRHLRFRRPGTMCMHFDILTWPGYLCYTGDMGTFVFRRLEDMLVFFRKGVHDPAFRIDLRYWAEKVEASDKHDGITEFSAESFKAEVKDYFEQATEESEKWPATRRAALWSEIEDQLFSSLDDSEHHAWSALHDFEHDGFRFTDWERDCRVYTQRFLWCCHALEWGIELFDRTVPQPTTNVLEAA